MATNLQTLEANQFVNIEAMIASAEAVGLPLWIAVAFVERESHGNNVYGHDSGGTYYGAGAVTESNYNKFYDLVINQHGRSNGVGPMQITWPGYFTDAKKKGVRLWNVSDNFEYGFRIIAGRLAGNYTLDSIKSAGTAYNGQAPYGAAVSIRADFWHRALVSAARPTPRVDVLRRGSVGKNVMALQVGLNAWFPSYSKLIPDGDFGPATEKVILEFQSRTGLLKDGVVGANTRSMLAKYKITF